MVFALPAQRREQIVNPCNGVSELSSIISTPMGAKTIKCHTDFTLRDMIACLRGGIISAVFSCAFFLGAARSFMMGVILPHSGKAGTIDLMGSLELALCACVGTSFLLMIVYSMDCRKSLTIDPFGLIVNSQLYEGIETRLLVPWNWLSLICLRKSQMRWVGTDFEMQTKYGMVYSLKWDEVMTSTVTETLIAAVRTMAPHAVVDLGDSPLERVTMQDSFTELWLSSLSSAVQRQRLDNLVAETVLSDGRYKIIGCLGSGGQGTAYLARDQKDGVDVVLKEYILPAHAGSDALAGSKQRINREIELMRSLHHDRIVQFLDHFVEDYRGYIVLEFISGSELKDYVEKRGPQPESVVIDMALQICDILEYLHELTPPVVHQDITPDNLIMQEEGSIKLVDFNVARQFACDGTSTVVGKHAYIPPEQFRGKATPQSDLYGLGCTLFYLLTAEESQPMTPSQPQIVDAEISDEMDKIVRKLTALSLTERFATAKECAEELRRLRPQLTISLDSNEEF
jgi:hypothetical protein